MIYLLLAICSSALISVGMRTSETRISNNIGMLVVNYMTCALIAWLYIPSANYIPAVEGHLVSVAGQTLLLGIMSGFFYLAGFVLFQGMLRAPCRGFESPF